MEAMRINFHVYSWDLPAQEAKYAIRVFTGGVNGLSGEPVKANMATVLKRLNGIERTQDYLCVRGGNDPAQQWLDGVSIALASSDSSLLPSLHRQKPSNIKLRDWRQWEASKLK